MPFWLWFPKKEEYPIDGKSITFLKKVFDIKGREVVLMWEPTLRFPSPLKKAIISVCKHDRIAQSLPKIVFIFRYHEQGKAYCETAQLLKGNLVVHINAKILGHKTLSKLVWLGLVAHEVTHLFHDYETAVIRNGASGEKRLRANLLRDEIKGVPQDLREDFFRFFRGLLIEGVARYNQYVLKQQHFMISEKQFKMLYDDVLTEVKEMSQRIDLALADAQEFDQRKGTLWLSKSFVKMMDTTMYDLGFDMVYSILFVDHNINFYNLFNMQHFEFIKKYEECMVIKGLQPLVSVTSGKGILDYRNLVIRLALSKKNSQKKTA